MNMSLLSYLQLFVQQNFDLKSFIEVARSDKNPEVDIDSYFAKLVNSYQKDIARILPIDASSIDIAFK